MWVGEPTSWTRLDSEILSDTVELPVRVAQLISGKLKSPRSRTGVGRAVIVVKLLTKTLWYSVVAFESTNTI